MEPIVLKNEFGEKIEVKWDDDGNIEVRHSDIDKARFGQLREYSKRAQQPKMKKFLKRKGIDAGNPLVKELLGRMGSSLIIDSESFIISAEETAMILEAVKQNKGIVPNWYSCD